MVLKAAIEKKISNKYFLKSVQKQLYADVLQKFFSVLKKFATLKNLCRSLFLIKFKKRLQHRSFPVNIAKFLKTAFFIEQLRWLLLLA